MLSPKTFNLISMKVPEQYRVKSGPLGSTPEFGCNGAFVIPCPPPKAKIFHFLCIVSDGERTGWEHVSVSILNVQTGKTSGIVPSWDEMCFVKGQFWDKEEAVLQIHPPASEYVNNHNACLHLWRCVAPGFEQPLPDSLMVGIKGVEIPI